MNKYNFLSSDMLPIRERSGWYDLIIRYFDQIQSAPHDGLKIYGMKEKYGSLRIDYMGGTSETSSLMDELENASVTVCQQCGNPGKSRDLPRIKTLCNKCFNDD